MTRTRRQVIIMVATGWLGSCTGGGATTAPPEPDAPPPGALTFSEGVRPIFTANCAFAQCHAGSDPQEGMDLSAGQAYAAIVDVPSRQVPRLARVEPRNPDSSYIILKLEGQAGTVGGVATQMPLGGALTTAQIDTIRTWIAAGAPDN